MHYYHLKRWLHLLIQNDQIMTNCRYLGENERIERISEFTVETRSAAFGLFVRIALNRSAELTVSSLSFPFSSYFIYIFVYINI